MFLVTGAYGFLGNTILRQLDHAGEPTRGLVFPGAASKALDGLKHMEWFEGDVCERESLRPFFEGAPEPVVIHTAGVISIITKTGDRMRQVNVGGTKNIVALCREYGARLLYVSSVHAIPERADGGAITETRDFDPAAVVGDYAKTKAEATKLVLEAEGLDARVVHPSGILGPGDYSRTHLTQMVRDYLSGRLWAGVKGGYDFVDVRDVAEGCLLAATKGRPGECYILSGGYYTIKEVLDVLSQVSGKRPIKAYLPLGLARATAPLAEGYYKMLHQPPLYTRYSLYTLFSNGNFSHEKATEELGFRPRPLEETLADTVQWLRENE